MTNFIAVVNKSTLVTDKDAYAMTLACDIQLRHHAAPVYGLIPPQVHFLQSELHAPRDAQVIAILDDPDQADALGWHTEGPDGTIYGRVFARPVLENGGNALSAALSVSSVLSHECLETLGDPHCNLWADGGDGTCTAYELADPVEGDSYAISIGAPGKNFSIVEVSNFVLPAWFDPQTPEHTRLDWLRTLAAPLSVRPTGYVITMKDGTVSQQFGERYPAWRKATKESPLSRTSRRLNNKEK